MDRRLLGSGPNAGEVGAFEGALHEGTVYYRPQQDCIMFTRDEVGFCTVCRRAIQRIIRLYAKYDPGSVAVCRGLPARGGGRTNWRRVAPGVLG